MIIPKTFSRLLKYQGKADGKNERREETSIFGGDHNIVPVRGKDTEKAVFETIKEENPNTKEGKAK